MGRNGQDEVWHTQLSEPFATDYIRSLIAKPEIGPSIQSYASPVTPPNLDTGCDGPGSHSLASLYAPSVDAKIWFIAQKGLLLPEPPKLFPEYTEPGGSEYVYRHANFWTSGFFPGCLYALLERRRRYQHLLQSSTEGTRHCLPHEMQLEFACEWWTERLHENATISDTHDLGFMITPWALRAWELKGNSRAYQTLCVAAKTLASRFSFTTGCIRSWDRVVTRDYEFKDPEKDFLLIIDNMMNLGLLFNVAAKTSSRELHDIAVSHAKTTQYANVRPDFSTTHLVVFDNETGKIRQYLTNQGYAHDSCWSRGQAWAIAGFAETYQWTLDESFLATARGCADYFIRRLPPSGIPPWDFEAPSGSKEPTDTSAALIAAYGMLLIADALRARGEPSHYLSSALWIINAVCAEHLSPPATFKAETETVRTVENGEELRASGIAVEARGEETIVQNATINNFEFAPRRWANHGLVYADYFFILVGNKLLEMGIGGHILDAEAHRRWKAELQ